ncbi:MAG TPA: FtsQ-type POTRA domain-containing protein [Ilumatobacteraceae bacterium]
MSRPPLPIGEGDVPDKALEELLAAFANDPAPLGAVDLDDPSIDALLGLAPSPGVNDLITEPVAEVPAPVAEPHAEPADTSAADAAQPDAARPDAATPDLGSLDAPAVEAVAATGPIAAPQDPPLINDPGIIIPTPPVDVTESGDQVTATDSSPPVRRTIQIGGGDDLPDALYLDEEAEQRLRGTSTRSTEASIREERTTILIGDDEIEGSAGGIPTGNAPMDPRLRARRIAVRRAMSRRRLKWVIVIAVVIIVGTGALALLGSSLFAIKNVAISGVVRTDPADIAAARKDLINHPDLLIDTHKIEVQLEKSPWVLTARVTTYFPHRATIEILERTPLATYLGTDNRYRIIDDQGQVVDVLRGRPIQFMLITGTGVNAEAGGSAGTPFAHAAQLVEALTPAARSRTESVAVSDTGELSLTFHDGTVVVLGAPTELLDKLIRLEGALQNDDFQTCGTIDASTNPLSCTVTKIAPGKGSTTSGSSG